MLPGLLIQSVLSGVLGGRPRKRGRRALRYLTGGTGGSLWSNPQTVLTAAGLAWGVFETLQTGNAASTPGSTPVADAGSYPAPASAVSVTVPPPVPPAGSSDSGGAAITPGSDDTMRIVRLAISAAHADGAMGDRERSAVVEEAKKAGIGDLIERELQSPRPLKEIVSGVTDPAAAATLYALAFSIVRADEQVSGSERIYLAQLAHVLRLDPEQVQALEKGVAERIDAVSDDNEQS
jgi:uncharacterized membrane protein YebE (DUF533 family)